MQSSPASEVRSIARSAVIVMIGLVLANIIGLCRSILIAKVFGTGADYDAFSAAIRLPDLLFNLMAGGALASAFIPTYTGLLTSGDRNAADRLASAIGNWIALLILCGAFLCSLFAPALIRGIIAPGFAEPEKIQKTVNLLRILFLCPFFFGLSGLVMGILNSHRRFFFAALAPMFYPLGMIIGIGALVPHWGIYGLAWGAVLGSILHLSIQLPALFALRSKYQPTLDYANHYVRNVVRLMAPRLIGQAAVQLNFLVNTILASAQPVGSLSAITWAFSLMMMPEIAVAQAGAIAALPTLSAQASQGQWESMRISLVSVLRAVFFLALPSSVGLIVLSRPIVQVVFERGSFDSHSTDMVAWALIFYAAGLPAHSLVEVLARAYFALQDTFTPAIVSVGGMVLNVALSIFLVRAFSNAGWMPHGGLALAVTLATTVELTVLILILRRKMNGWMDRSSWISFGRTCLSSAVLALVLWLWLRACGSASKWIAGLGGIFIGLTTYGGLNLLLGSPEEKAVIRSVERRLQPAIHFFRH